MKKIALIYMGGTFGCIGNPLSPMPAAEFLPKLQHVLPLDAHIECFVAPSIQDSSACTAHDWLSLTAQIQALQQQDYQHFVILHGTDTLSYASAVLAHYIADSAHVVLTGSQYPLLTIDGSNTRDFSDALDNLNLALHTVTHQPAGVYLAFHHQVLHGRTALKHHSTELDAFVGIAATEPCAVVKAYVIDAQCLTKAKNFNCMSLMAQPISKQQLNQNLSLLFSNPPDCLILQGFGTANLAVDDELIKTFQQLHAKNCAIVLTSQVPLGQIDQHYAINSWLENAPVLLSNCYGHADLYAKALKMYLQYDHVEQWYHHWQDESILR